MRLSDPGQRPCHFLVGVPVVSNQKWWLNRGVAAFKEDRPNAVFLFSWTLDRNQNQATAFDSLETCQCRRWKRTRFD
jgi:hypothetical protein